MQMRKTLLIVPLLASVLTAAAGPEQTGKGTITGVVRFVGKPPAAEKIMVTDGSTIQHRPLVIDGQSQGLQGVFVVLADAPKQPTAKDLRPAVMDQRDWVFLPRVLAVQEGQEVEFQNNDGVNHGVHVTSGRAENEFNLVLSTGSTCRCAFVPQPEPIAIGCALHPWMRGWVYVVRHPWFAVTDAKGAFGIKEVPPGKYRLECRHSDVKLRARRDVEVKPGQETKVAIDWDRLSNN
jgi:plastocyanin